MVQERTQLAHADGEVGTEKLLAEIVEKLATGRGLLEGRSTRVSGGVPGVFVDEVELDQCRGHRPQDISCVFPCGGQDASAQEGCAVLEQPDHLGDRRENILRQHGRLGAVEQQEEGNLFVARADQMKEVERGPVVRVSAQSPGHEQSVQGGVGKELRLPVRRSVGRNDRCPV